MAHTPLTREQLIDEGLDWLFELSFLVYLSRSEQDEAIGLMRRRRYRAGDHIIEMGQSPRGVDLIIEGKTVVEVLEEGGTRVAGAGPGRRQLLGETAVANDGTAMAFVTAACRVGTLHFPAAEFKAFYDRCDSFRRYIDNLMEIRRRWPELMGLLSHNPFLRILGREDLGRLLTACTLERPARGGTVIRAGEPGDDVYIVNKGTLEVLGPRKGNLRRPRLKIARHGELVGEVALLMQTPRTADVVAGKSRNTELLRVTGATFVEVVNRNPMVRRQFATAMAAMGLELGPGSRPATDQAVPFVCGVGRGLGATTLAYGVAGALREAVDLLLVDLDGAESARKLGLKASNSKLLGFPVREAKVPSDWGFRVVWPKKRGDAPALLDALREDPSREESGRYALFTGRLEDESAKETFRRANDVIYLRRGDGDLADLPLRDGHQLFQAVRIGDDVSLPIATNRKTARVPEDPDSVSIFWERADLGVVCGERTPFGRAADRVVRLLRGRSVGVALGGGGAFGYAHIGLIRVMREAGIPIDFLTGTSFGSLVGAQYVAADLEGLDLLITKGRQMVALTFGSLIIPALCGKYIDRLNGKTRMNETEVPFYPVSLNLVTGREYVLPRGTLGDAVHSASCLPGMFPAWRVSTSARLVDGGMINNVPVSTLFDVGADFIVGSNIVPPNPEGASLPLGNRPIPAKTRMFGMLERVDDLMRSVTGMMSQTGRDRAVQADFLFDLQIEGFEAHDFHRGADIARHGYQQARLMQDDIRYAYDNDLSIRF